MYRNYTIRQNDVLPIIEEILNILIKIFKENDIHNTLFGLPENALTQLLDDYNNFQHEVIYQCDFSKLPNTYPIRPFIYQIAYQLDQMMSCGKCQTMFLKQLYLLIEEYGKQREKKFMTASDIASEAGRRWTSMNDAEKLLKLKEILRIIEWRGILDMLGIRKTVGTLDILPPPKEKLLEAFNCHYPGSKNLTVGAKALAKHCNRDITVKWWGESKGSESNKSDQALKKVSEILDNVAWINIHRLPHQLKILEVRIEEGYGARWNLEENKFIGFVEPQKNEGWVDKYRH